MVKVLLLNASYEPLNLISRERAIKLMFLEKIQVIVESSEEWRSVTMAIKVPSVVRLLEYVKHRKYTKIRFSRRNVLIRDDFTCQYCAKEFPADKLTMDHVVPRAQGGKTEFTNIVTACRPCNLKKDDKRLHHTGMKLIKRPKEPQMILLTMRIARYKKVPQEWQQFMLQYNK